MGGAKVVHALGAWAAAAGCALHPEARWGGGLTALHVATLLREPVEVALALTGAGMWHAGMRWQGCLAWLPSQQPRPGVHAYFPRLPLRSTSCFPSAPP